MPWVPARGKAAILEAEDDFEVGLGPPPTRHRSSGQFAIDWPVDLAHGDWRQHFGSLACRRRAAAGRRNRPNPDHHVWCTRVYACTLTAMAASVHYELRE